MTGLESILICFKNLKYFGDENLKAQMFLYIYRFPRKRDYEYEKRKLKSELVVTSEHPLRGTVVTVSWNFTCIT